jgi:hypothetical protein
MPNYAVYLFGEVQGNGWSESYPMVASTAAAAAVTLSSILDARKAMMLPDAAFTGGRISDTDIKNDSWPLGITFPVVGTYTATGITTTYNPQIALREIAYAGGLRRGSRWIRALPEDQLNASGAYTPTGPWATLLFDLNNLIIANVSIATKLKGAIVPPFYLYSTITAIDTKRAEARAIGRPFGLRRGRRLIA